MKKVVGKLKEAGKDEEYIKGFQKGVQDYYTKKLMPNFRDLDFYTGESLDPEGMYVVFSTSRDQRPRIHADIASQGRISQLPRGRCYTIRHYLEAWLDGDESLDPGARYQSGFCDIVLALLPNLRSFPGHAKLNQLPYSAHECDETHPCYLAKASYATICC